MSVAIRYWGGRNNNRATLTDLFEAGTLQRLSELELGPPTYTENIAHQAENASFNVKYAYVATKAIGSFSGGENKEQIPNIFKEAMSLPQAARWKVDSDKEITSLEKHGVYELIPITSVPNGRKVVDSRWVYKLKKQLMHRFEMTDMGGVWKVLGMNVTRNREETITINQKDYTEDIVQRYEMRGCNPAYTLGVGP